MIEAPVRRYEGGLTPLEILVAIHEDALLAEQPAISRLLQPVEIAASVIDSSASIRMGADEGHVAARFNLAFADPVHQYVVDEVTRLNAGCSAIAASLREEFADGVLTFQAQVPTHGFHLHHAVRKEGADIFLDVEFVIGPGEAIDGLLDLVLQRHVTLHGKSERRGGPENRRDLAR
jgi:hypothetical protein